MVEASVEASILTLVRHGETSANVDGVWHGSTDGYKIYTAHVPAEGEVVPSAGTAIGETSFYTGTAITSDGTSFLAVWTLGDGGITDTVRALQLDLSGAPIGDLLHVSDADVYPRNGAVASPAPHSFVMAYDHTHQLRTRRYTAPQ